MGAKTVALAGMDRGDFDPVDAICAALHGQFRRLAAIGGEEAEIDPFGRFRPDGEFGKFFGEGDAERSRLCHA